MTERKLLVFKEGGRACATAYTTKSQGEIYSNYDKHRGVNLPSRPNKKLAYLCGVICGDGHIRFTQRLRKSGFYSTQYEVSIRMNNREVLKKCAKIIKECFSLDVKIRRCDSGSSRFASSRYISGLVFGSKAIFWYLTHKLDMLVGKKFSRIKIPKWVKKYKGRTVAFIKGFFDADGCLTTWPSRHPHTLKDGTKKIYRYVYPRISFSSKSKAMIKDIKEFFNKTRITSTITRYDELYKIQCIGNKNYIKWNALMRRGSI